jgi:transcriptional regulator with XRE-family HTH domain
MKKYSSLAELLKDYRDYHNLSQLDMAAKLDVDVRTVIRWEKNESLVKQEKEKDFVENLGIPHQVIRNLNTEKPIPIYFDFFRRVYSYSVLSQNVSSTSSFIKDMELETDRIHLISSEKDIEFITYIQKLNKNSRPLKAELILKAAQMLPDLNLVIYSYSGFCAGHITILPLKYSSYQKIRNQEMLESNLDVNDFTFDLTIAPQVFYYYSLYADSVDNSYYLLNRVMSHFKKQKYENYIFAGISYRKLKIELLKQLGLNVVWEKPLNVHGEDLATLMEGNLDQYLFGKKEDL